MKTLEDLPIQEGSRVLVRLDVNVPITDGIIHDDFRIAESVPTIRYLAQKKA
ncbi:MAG TPA: phosphoglycerate kinase, partial [Candidatus Paceibacterota bacterium]|nr:phosphoglycerate kinase [Candidatus Paceibacterota bacterium]